MRKNPALRFYFNPPEADAKGNQHTQEAIDRAKNENKQVFDRMGPRWVYTRLLETGALNRPDMTPIESVRAADAETALAIVSDKNAGG